MRKPIESMRKEREMIWLRETLAIVVVVAEKQTIGGEVRGVTKNAEKEYEMMDKTTLR
jgi:hypothetical protein